VVTRVTRADSRARTRARLLEAAAEVFVERGFHGASVEEIAERAGFTRGAVYSNFRDKAELLQTLLDERMARGVAEVTDIVSNAAGPAEMFAGLRARAASIEPDADWLVLRTEFWLYAMRHPEARPGLADRDRALRAQYAAAIEAQFDAVGLEPPAPLDQLALVVQLLDEGIPARRWIDPALGDDVFLEALVTLFEAGVALSTSRVRSR
jgi:AcrR family transcriptional regulator